ncbi:MAG: AAA domain-containing protein [bacterium]
MLQEATKLLNTAFHSSFIKKLSQYLHDCVREEVKSATFRNLKQDKDNKWYFIPHEETLLTQEASVLELDGINSLVTELMMGAATSHKESYLLYGYLFLTGKNYGNKRGEEFLTPLLYAPCKLERDKLNINCSLTEEFLTLNTGALSALIQTDDEDEADQLFDELIDVVPDFPLTEEKIQIFLTTLKSIFPQVHVKLAMESPFNVHGVDSVETDSGVQIKPVSAIVLTKRPSITAGVLHELTQIAEKSSGAIRETALEIINEEYIRSSKKEHKIEDTEHKKKPSAFFPVVPLEISQSQENVIEAIEKHSLVAVYGPPGTGKSQTIVNLVSHLVANGKTVLVASRMDKAIDVVADRLNELGAPYMALRAGRQNYQKQLYFQLQDLLSNKVDIDTGFEDSILVSLDDMKNLLNTIKDLEEKCERIIKLEKDWSDYLAEQESQTKNVRERILEPKMNNDEIAIAFDVIEKIEEYLESRGFLNSIFKSMAFASLKKILGLKNISLDYMILQDIKEELSLLEITNNLRRTEIEINKIGNVHQLLENIRLLKRKQRNLAVDILKNQRRNSLKRVIGDQVKRQRLIVHSKALIERKKNLQNRLLEEEDFRPLLETFPCWSTTTYAISESLPLKPGMFDVAIIDEASQCDIASCFPVLFRAKKAIIVGDDKQLSHLSFLEKSKEQSFLSQHAIPDRYQLMWRFRTNSMFDLANYYSVNPVLLDEHFRSLPPIINFSNEEFYGGRIRIMNKNTDVKDTLELHVIKDAKVDLDTTRNMAETEAVLKRLSEIIAQEKDLKKPSSIGIISPFRGQVDQIKKAVSQILDDRVVERHQIEIGTAHTFQGDEKDIIMLSFTLAENSHFQSLTFLQKPNLFNVAITRAKKKTIVFVSKDPKDLSQGLLRRYLDYIKEQLKKEQRQTVIGTQDIEENIYNNIFEKEVAKACKKEGYNVMTGFDTAGYKIDIVISEGDKKLGIECDGLEDEGQRPTNQIKKQFILERCGWKILRVSAREWHYSQKVCLDKIKQQFESL